MTKAEYDQLDPLTQGYVQYVQGGWPGSELAHVMNPYPKGTVDHDLWQAGQQRAVIEAQDSEEE